MDTNRLVVVVAGIVAIVVVLAIGIPPLLATDRSSLPARPAASTGPAGRPDRTRPPVVGGAPLALVGAASRPPAPTQWAAGPGGIPSNTWWSSAVTGPGAISLWPQPLGLRITEGGEVQVAAPDREVRADGSSEAAFVPALFLGIGPATTSVVDHGPLHVTIRLQGAGDRRIDLTLVQGSPLVELRATGPVDVRAPGLDLAATGGRVPVARFGTSEGPWVVAAGSSAAVVADGDDLSVTPGPEGRLAIGPVPEGAGPAYDDDVLAVAAHPLTGSRERVTVAADGATTQVLTQERGPAADATSLWALQPHHQRYAVGTAPPLGTVASPLGRLPVVAGAELRLSYPAVPVLWSAVRLPGAPAIEDGSATPSEGSGSYYGGKAAYTAAARGDVLRAGGDDAGAEAATAEAERLLDTVTTAGASPSVAWDAGWGSVVVEPAEFGAGTELNDHQLQYGYWVAAAAHVAEVDPEAAARYRPVVDLLVADYAGAAALPGSSSSLPDERTWSPYEGHSWASGTARFGAGNDLESISESNLAWWAAARWLLATGRADEAEVFVGRFTIESALVGTSWLPQGDQLPTDATQRPWSGVVWSAKVDLATWFDPLDESALGIRLLPLGPASLARYASPTAVDAARARWAWCDDHGGCTTRWSNLLDSDAAVAGRDRLTGPEPEPSTQPMVSAWWRDVWTRSELVVGWSCSVGAVPRRLADGSVVVLASSPTAEPATLSCRDEHGELRWTAPVHGTTVGRTTEG